MPRCDHAGRPRPHGRRSPPRRPFSTAAPRMEKLEHALWIVDFVNAIFGPLVAALLAPLGFTFADPAKVIPNYIVMCALLVIVFAVLGAALAWLPLDLLGQPAGTWLRVGVGVAGDPFPAHRLAMRLEQRFGTDGDGFHRRRPMAARSGFRPPISAPASRR